MKVGPWVPFVAFDGADFSAVWSRYAGPWPVGVIMVDTRGNVTSSYSGGDAWQRTTKPDDVEAAACMVNAKLQTLGYDCDDSLPAVKVSA